MNKNSIVFKTTLMITVILMTAFFCACEKNGSINANSNAIAESIVSFADYEDYNKTLNKVLAMNEEELKNYEESKGYRSFGRASEELYRSIKWDEFESKEDIISFVEQNSHYLKLIEDENGELELETKFYKRADRYFLNLDNIYQVGESVYKVFEEGIVIANSKDIIILTKSGNDFDYYKTDARFTVATITENGSPNLKSTNGDCGTSHTWRSTNGNNRLKVKLEFDIYTYYSNYYEPPNCWLYEADTHFLMRPYKRTFGIWYWCSRTMKTYSEWTYKYWNSDDCCHTDADYGWNNDDWLWVKPWTHTSKIESISFSASSSCNSGKSYMFTSFDIWADTYDVSPINVSCN